MLSILRRKSIFLFAELITELQQNTNTRRVQQNVPEQYNEPEHIYYYCHHSLYYHKPNAGKEKGLQILKSQGYLYIYKYRFKQSSIDIMLALANENSHKAKQLSSIKIGLNTIKLALPIR